MSIVQLIFSVILLVSVILVYVTFALMRVSGNISRELEDYSHKQYFK